ncbi:MAG: biotin/lipoyl-binding protein, partial [Firmicutes bacterium]|nr:biotin/lipoyl-binding protein [Bacillota bacterium]
CVVLGLVAAAMVLGLVSLRNRNNKAFVQRVGDANCSWVLSNSSSGGMVTEAAQQSFFLQETQQVQQVYVSAGDQVDKGDALFQYDTRSLELEVKQRELEVSSCAGSLAIARQQLTAYENITPSEPAPPAEPQPYQPTAEQRLPEPYQGDGSEEEPFIYLCRETTLLTGSQINSWIAEGQVALLELREGDAPEGELLSSWRVDGRNFLPVEDDSFWNVASHSRWLPPQPEPEPEPAGPTYTQAEKDKLIARQKLTIRRMENSLALAENALEQSRAKLSDATVRADMSGTVEKIGDPAAPPQDGSAFCVVAAASGATVTGYVSELELADRHAGDRLTVFNWMTGETTEAVVTAVSDYPAGSNQYGQGQGNPNVSYYEFTAYMENASGFEAGQGVEIRPYVEDLEQVIVLEAIYVRSDDQGSYVMVDDGSGRLARREVTVEPTPESSYLQITSGLAMDDYFAFPYGKAGRVGTLTTTRMPLIMF